MRYNDRSQCDKVIHYERRDLCLDLKRNCLEQQWSDHLQICCTNRRCNHFPRLARRGLSLADAKTTPTDCGMSKTCGLRTRDCDRS